MIIYIDAINQKIENREELARKISDIHFGIGSDGMILICKSEIADYKMEIYNADGSQAEMCGNGIRCFGKFLYENNFTKKRNKSRNIMWNKNTVFKCKGK